MASTSIDPLLAQIQTALPDFLLSRRWYRAKARTIASATLADVATANGFLILLAHVHYTDGESDTYLLPVTSSAHKGDFEEVITTLETEDGATVTIYSALSERGFRDTMFKALACGAGFPGQHGEFKSEPSPYFVNDCSHQFPALDSFVSRVQQSNSSLVYGNKYILKLFRKLEPGINPDIEIGRHLTHLKFPHSPAVLGTFDYVTDTLTYAAGILQEFVPNQGDAWKYSLDCLTDYYSKALAPGNTVQPTLPTRNPLALMQQVIPPAMARLIGPYLASAALLGQRTAEMHIALASSNEYDFAPEPFTAEDATILQADMLSQALSTLTLVREKDPSAKLLSHEPAILSRFNFLKTEPIAAARIRHHGDYHLGQVLYTGSDFMIIDFEGEPARPLAHRRGKTLALKDVAGMVRSFQYAAYAAMPPGAEAWAEVWNGWVSATYLNSYFEHASSHAFAPTSQQERLTLLNAFLLQKALYEVAYELNNRPDWVAIPTRGILSLVE